MQNYPLIFKCITQNNGVVFTQPRLTKLTFPYLRIVMTVSKANFEIEYNTQDLVMIKITNTLTGKHIIHVLGIQKVGRNIDCQIQ